MIAVLGWRNYKQIFSIFTFLFPPALYMFYYNNISNEIVILATNNKIIKPVIIIIIIAVYGTCFEYNMPEG